MTNATIEAHAPKAWRRMLFAGAAVIALATASGCSSAMDDVEFRVDTSPPKNTSLTRDRIEIQHGIAVGVTALPQSGGEEISTSLSMTSTDPTIFGVESVSGNQFILYGTFPGTATLRIIETSRSDGGQVDVPVTVLEQSP